MTLGTLLRLGRVSNLPTVWTNAIAGLVLAGGAGESFWFVLLFSGLALTLFYEGGMWLNDAFDAEIDANERAKRPIPQGEVGVQTVFAGGFAMLAAGIAIAFSMGTMSGLAGIVLALAV
ncbi:MAG: UbiA family prenyltransferase, partial [Pseudomonadota bacterium]